MIKTRKNKNLSKWIGSLFIILSISLPMFKFIYEYSLNQKEDEKIEDFFEEPVIEDKQETIIEEPVEEKKQNINISYNYIAVVEIPSISLKKGLVSINDDANNVDKNIQILQGSNMPNIDNGILMLASHSGTGRVAYFRNLEKVKINDLVYIYFNGIKYLYKIVNTYHEIKDGSISVKRNINKTTLLLTTCSQEKGKQLVVISELIEKESY